MGQYLERTLGTATLWAPPPRPQMPVLRGHPFGSAVSWAWSWTPPGPRRPFYAEHAAPEMRAPWPAAMLLFNAADIVICGMHKVWL